VDSGVYLIVVSAGRSSALVSGFFIAGRPGLQGILDALN
jgi:hypothetical protein